MNSIVLVKQVPETKAVKMDEKTGTVIRQGVESIVNPLDLYAVEAALELKNRYGGTVTVLTMGPPQAAKALREVLSMGADEALLISDRAYAGSDTWATSRILAEGIRSAGEYDLIIAGERATDGDTGQVGPEVAAALDLPVATYINRIDGIENNVCFAGRLVETGEEMLEIHLPALLTVVKEIGNPRLPTLDGKIRARKTDIPLLTNQQLKLPDEEIGLKGSPTKVMKIFRPKVTRECLLLHGKDSAALSSSVEQLCCFLKDKEIL